MKVSNYIIVLLLKYMFPVHWWLIRTVAKVSVKGAHYKEELYKEIPMDSLPGTVHRIQFFCAV